MKTTELSDKSDDMSWQTEQLSYKSISSLETTTFISRQIDSDSMQHVTAAAATAQTERNEQQNQQQQKQHQQ